MKKVNINKNNKQQNNNINNNKIHIKSNLKVNSKIVNNLYNNSNIKNNNESINNPINESINNLINEPINQTIKTINNQETSNIKNSINNIIPLNALTKYGNVIIENQGIEYNIILIPNNNDKRNHYLIYDDNLGIWKKAEGIYLDNNLTLKFDNNKIIDNNKNVIIDDLENNIEEEITLNNNKNWKIKKENDNLIFYNKNTNGSWIEDKKIKIYQNSELIENLHYPNIYTGDKELNHILRISNDDILINDMIIKHTINYENNWMAPIFILKPGEILKIDLFNDIYNFNEKYDKFNINLKQDYLEYYENIPESTNFYIRGLYNNLFDVNPGNNLVYTLKIPENTFGGLYIYQPYFNNNAINQINKGLSGLLYIEGPYQKRLFDNNIQNKFLLFNKLNLKKLNEYNIATNNDNDNKLPTYIYNVDKYGNELTLTNIDDNKNIWLPLLNGQVNPIISIGVGELQIWNFANCSTNMIIKLNIKNHDIIVVGKDGIPRNSKNYINNKSIDPDFVFTPSNKRLNYIIVGPGQRFDFFVIPKIGFTPKPGQIFNIYNEPINESELFFNSNTNQYNKIKNYNLLDIKTEKNGLEYNIIIGKLIYTNLIYNHDINALIPNINIDKNALPVDNYKNKSYLFTTDYPNYHNEWMHQLNIENFTNYNGLLKITLNNKHFLKKNNIINTFFTIKNSKIYDGKYLVYEIIDDYTLILNSPYLLPDNNGILIINFYTIEKHIINLKNIIKENNNIEIICNEPHKLNKNNPIYINNNKYKIYNIIDDYSFIIDTNNIFDINHISCYYETINLDTSNFYLYGKQLPNNIENKITNRRKIYFDSENINLFNDDKYMIFNNVYEEWIIYNKSSTLNIFHTSHYYQLCAYKDYNFICNLHFKNKSEIINNLNIINDSNQYTNFFEIGVPFEGYEDTTFIPCSQQKDNFGEIRLRINFKENGINFINIHKYTNNNTNTAKIIEIVSKNYDIKPIFNNI